MVIFVAGVVYVDHAGATLHADSQLKAALEDFSSNLYGNPRILLVRFPALIANCFKLFRAVSHGFKLFLEIRNPP